MDHFGRASRVLAVVLSLMVITAACSGDGGNETASTSSAVTSTTSPTSTSTTIAPTTIVVTTTTPPQGPAVQPIVIDIDPDPTGHTLLRDAVAEMLDSVTFHFVKEIDVATGLDPGLQVPVSMHGTSSEGVVTPDGASVRGEEGQILDQVFGHDAVASALLDAQAEGTFYEAVDSGDGLFLHAPLLAVVDELIGVPSSTAESDRPLAEGWTRLDASPPWFLSDAMGLGGDPLPTDPRELLEFIGSSDRVGSPTPDDIDGQALTRVDVVVPLSDLFLLNGDGDISTVVDLFDAAGFFDGDSLDALDRALRGSDALISAWINEAGLVTRIEYGLGADAIGPALSDPDLADALNSLGLRDHSVLTFDGFDDPGNTVTIPTDFTSVDPDTLDF